MSSDTQQWWYRIKYTGTHMLNPNVPVSGTVDVLAESKDKAMSSYSTYVAIRARAKATMKPLDLRKAIDIKCVGMGDGSRSPEIDPRDEEPPIRFDIHT